jgi:hypothetical protein
MITIRELNAVQRPAIGRLLLATIVGASMFWIGCHRAGTVPEATVSGAVTVGGAPAPRGSITFSPAPGEVGPVAGTTIEDGRFHCEHVAVGKLNVTFNLQAAEPKRFTDAFGTAREVPVSLLASKYQAGMPTQTHEGENQLNFALDPPDQRSSVSAR